MERPDRIVLRFVLRRLRLGVRGLKALVLPVDRRRWAKEARSEPVWNARNERIAALLGPARSVIDLGSGAQTLRRHLPDGCAYRPCDVVASSEDVLLCDFNRGRYPETDETFDIAVCSGVLEYVRTPREFLRRVPDYARHVILTYAPNDETDSRLKRLGRGWVNHLTQAHIEGLFDELGLAWTLVDTWEEYNRHLIYRIEGQADKRTREAG